MNTKRNERGFTYIDLLIGVLILLVGVMALASAVTAAVIRTREGEQQLNAKQLGTATLENIFSVRDIGPLGWDAVGNRGNNVVAGQARGIFVVGQQPIRANAGLDGVVGTLDDNGADLPGYQRQIVITDYDDPQRRVIDGFPIMMRRIDVTIFYNVGNVQRRERVSTMISNYAVQ